MFVFAAILQQGIKLMDIPSNHQDFALQQVLKLLEKLWITLKYKLHSCVISYILIILLD